MILHGENLIIKVNGTAIAAAKSCTVSVESNLIPTSSPLDGGWTHVIAGRNSWSVRTNHLLIDNALSNIGTVGATVTIVMECKVNGTTIGTKTGTAICRQWEGTFTKGNLAQGSFIFQGSGPLS